MNILLINHYSGSPIHGMEYRPYYLSREWVRAEHKVRIVAGAYSHVRATQPMEDGYAISNKTLEYIDGIEYVWYPIPAYKGNGVGRIRNIWAFLRQVWADAKCLVDDFYPDAVIASSTYPMDIWAASRLAARAKAKLIFEVHDLWPLTPIELHGMSPYHPFVLLCQLAENTAYRCSDIVVSMLPKVHEHMEAHGLDLRKLHIIPNGISPDDWQGESHPIDGELAHYIQTVHEKGNLLVGYAGAHGLPNALDALLDGANLLKGEAMRFLLVGSGHEKARLQKRIVDERLSNVKMFESIPKKHIPALLKEFDIAYLGWQHKPIYRFGIAPNKLMDYMMAGRTVLHSVEAGNDPVAEAQCGLTVPPESQKAIADGLLKLAAMTRAEREAMGKKGRTFVLEHHTYPVLAERFIEVLTSVQL